MVTKSASSTTMVYTLRSPGRSVPLFSLKDELSIVAKYSDRLMRMSEWAYMMRFRARVCGGEED